MGLIVCSAIGASVGVVVGITDNVGAILGAAVGMIDNVGAILGAAVGIIDNVAAIVGLITLYMYPGLAVTNAIPGIVADEVNGSLAIDTCGLNQVDP